MQDTKTPVLLLRKPAILATTSIPETSWDRGVKQGRFPKPVKIGPRAVAWLSTDIDALIERLKNDRNNAA